MNVVIVGCSRRKFATTKPVAALDLYQGGCVPLIRPKIVRNPWLRSAVFILSAEHGLVRSDDLIHWYDRPLTLERAEMLRPLVMQSFVDRILHPLSPKEILVAVEALYFVMLADILTLDCQPVIHWIPSPVRNWDRAESTLDAWEWPK